MKNLLVAALVTVGFIANADIASPGTVNCKVTQVSPEGANFFNFAHVKGPVIGDTITQDLNVAEIVSLKFASGAEIGSTIVPHPLVKSAAESFDGVSLFESSFKSQHNGNNYIGRIQAIDAEETKVQVHVQALEIPQFGPMVLNSLELECTRN